MSAGKSPPVYLDHTGPDELRKLHPIGAAFEDFARRISRDELFMLQDRQFQRCLTRAWQTGFYRRLWGAAGIEPGDVRGLADIHLLPTFDKSDLMASIAAHPPFGDFAGERLEDPAHQPMILHTTSGTTGDPQVLLFGARSREIQNLILGRIYRFQGLRHDDVVHSVYGHGMINGGHYIREAVLHWTQALFLSAGTGVETRSLQQVQLMKRFGVTVLAGFADYLKRLAEVAMEQGIRPGEDIPVRLISGQLGGDSREAIGKLWGGAPCMDWYGVGDTGAIAGKGPDQDGLYLMEDAHYVELCDIDLGTPVPHGQPGDMVCTCLFKDDVYPIIRFNTHDLTRELDGSSALGWKLRRIAGHLGRSDQMVKIKGINLFPQAIGPILSEVKEFLGEYVCRREDDPTLPLVVVAEVSAPSPQLAQRMGELLKDKTGIALGVELVAAGQTAEWTQVERRQKPIRLIDNRNPPGGSGPAPSAGGRPQA